MTSALPMIVPQLTHSRRTGKPTGQKPPLQPKEVWAIRVRLHIAVRGRDLAFFNLAIDSKLRGCDLVYLKVGDVAQMGQARARAFDWSGIAERVLCYYCWLRAQRQSVSLRNEL